jgi:hypothetical protein
MSLEKGAVVDVVRLGLRPVHQDKYVRLNEFSLICVQKA